MKTRITFGGDTFDLQCPLPHNATPRAVAAWAHLSAGDPLVGFEPQPGAYMAFLRGEAEWWWGGRIQRATLERRKNGRTKL